MKKSPVFLFWLAASAAFAAGGAGIRIDGNRLIAETRTLSARIERGVLTSLVRKSDGRELVSARAEAGALSLLYPNGESVPLHGAPGDRFDVSRVNGVSADLRIHSWHGDAVLSVSVDAETGDLVLEPSAYSSRAGVRAVRWTLRGVAPGHELVAPFFQGVRVPLEEALVRNTRWGWPMFWEAGLAILQGASGGFWVHCRDDRYRYKALQVGATDDARSLGFETEAFGPAESSLGAGGLAWRVNVFDGDWTIPAARYRDWYAEALEPGRAPRPEWLAGLRFAVSWCPCDTAILDALARRLEPSRVLLHVPDWRSDPYDQNYPAFRPSDRGAAFIRKAMAMGFRTMPHFNSIDMDPTHPVYDLIRDFQYRNVETRQVAGWVWHEGVQAVPESNAARLLHRDWNTMVKVHPGLSMWRSVLADSVHSAVRALSLELAFLDVTLCTWNLANALVEDATPTEGMRRLVAHVAELEGGLAVGGEGRNEVTASEQSLAQVHLFKSWQENFPGIERLKPCGLNEFLFGRWCRSFGYSALDGKSPASGLRMRLHTALGAIPTVTIDSAGEIDSPNAAVREMLESAGAR